jgi:hypothetical protein
MTQKTTILFPTDLYSQLRTLARLRKISIGELVRSACMAQYGILSQEERLLAVEELGRMSAPVGTPEEMERESVPDEVDTSLDPH